MTSVADILGPHAANADLGQLRGTARQLSRIAEEAASVRIRAQFLDAASWEGRAAELFRARRTDATQPTLRRLEEICEGGSQAVVAWAVALADLLDRARALAHEIDHAAAATAASRVRSKTAKDAALRAAARRAAATDPATVAVTSAAATKAGVAAVAARVAQANAERHEAELRRRGEAMRAEYEQAARHAASTLRQAGGLPVDASIGLAAAGAFIFGGGAFRAGWWNSAAGAFKTMFGSDSDGTADTPRSAATKPKSSGRTQLLKRAGPLGTVFGGFLSGKAAWDAYQQGREGDAAMELVAGGITLNPAAGAVDFVTGGFLGDGKGLISGVFAGFHGDVLTEGTDGPSKRALNGEYGPAMWGIALYGDHVLATQYWETYQLTRFSVDAMGTPHVELVARAQDGEYGATAQWLTELAGP